MPSQASISRVLTSDLGYLYKKMNLQYLLALHSCQTDHQQLVFSLVKIFVLSSFFHFEEEICHGGLGYGN